MSKLFRRFYDFIISNNIIMDNLVFEESINSELSQSEFVDKQWLYINDNNNGSYSSQIILDTTPLSNAGGYINWSEAFIAIPLVLQLESTAIGAVVDGKNADFVLGMKNGYFQILHSLTCDFNNGNIIQQVPFLNVFSSFKCMTSWSDGDVKNWGSVCGFAPDSSRSWIYNSIAGVATTYATASGTGLCNNRLAPLLPILTPGTAAGATNQSFSASIASSSAADYRPQYNAGLLKRIQYLNYSLEPFAATSPYVSNQQLLLGATTMTAQTFMGYVDTGNANTRAIIFDAVVRLKDVADFFQKCPLLKGATMRIALNTNQCFFPFSATNTTYVAATGIPAAAGALFLTQSPTILGGGGTNPIMISSADIGQGFDGIAGLSGTLANSNGILPTAVAQATITGKVALSIVRTQFVGGNFMTNTIAAPITSVRLYAPCYTMSPIAEQRYLSLTPTKKVVYNDIFQYQFNDVPASNFNLLVSNGITNVRGVVVVPFLNSASNGNNTTGVAPYNNTIQTDTLLSPFATSGGTPDPIALTNFNIQVSGKNLFLQQLQYTYEQFVEQLVSSNQLNGSLTTSLASGLIGKEDFEFLYRYYYGNVSRSLPSEDGVAKSIQILGTISTPATAVKVNFMVFVEFEREITIDVRTGARIA